MTKKICFVIQPFSDLYDNRYKSVYEPAIKDAGLIPYRTGGDSVDDITKDIRYRIRNEHMCFADITEDKPNVWYEVGFAHACYKQVVMVCDEEKRPSKNLPFDINARNVLFYKGKEVDSGEFYCDGFIKRITKRVKVRSEEADSGSNPPATAQQSQNSDNLTALEGEVLKAICSYSSRYNRAISREDIISNPFSADGDVPDAIGKIKLDEYIDEIPGFLCDDGQSRYCPTKKGERWYYANKDIQSTHSTSSGNDATG